MNQKTLLITHLVFYGILLAIIAVEFAYRQPLFDRSIITINHIQSKRTAAADGFFLALSWIGEGPLYFVAFFLIFNWGGRPRAFYYLTLLTGVLCLMNLTKMAYHNPRPFMVDDRVRAIDCSHEYGNPSGHSQFAAGFFIFMFLDFFHSENKEVRKNKLMYRLSLLGVFAIVFLIGFSRLYVGVHSIDQIIYGWQLGTWMAFYYHFCLRGLIISHIKYVIELQHENKLNVKKYFIISTVVFVVILMSQIVTYLIVDTTFTPLQEWLDRLDRECGYEPPSQTLLNKSLVYSGAVGMFYGAYLGILVHKHYYGVMWKHMFRTSWLKFILRLIVMAVIAAPFSLPFFLIPRDQSLAVLVIFKFLLTVFTISFAEFAFAHYFFSKWHLLNTEHVVRKVSLNKDISMQNISINRERNSEQAPLLKEENF